MTKINYVFVTIMMIIALVLCYIMMSYPFFWYDEAGQVWIAKGLNHYSDALSQEGGLMDVVRNNRNYNMDPGGFSILLWFWVKISSNVLFIRFVPFIFFLVACYFIYRYFKKIGYSTYISIIVGLLPFVIPIINTRLYEVRAYSMELAGCILAVFAIQCIKDKVSIKSLIWVSILLAFFTTSRYGFIIVAFYASIRLLLFVIRNSSYQRIIKCTIAYSIPLISVLLLIYFGMTKYQDHQAMYVGYLSQSLRLLISPLSILFYLNILCLLIKIRKKQTISELQIAAVSIASLYFVLSFLSLYPWDFHRTISASFLLSLSLCESLISFVKNDKVKEYGLFVTMIALLLFNTVRLNQKFNKMYEDEPMRELISLKESNPNALFFIASHYSPITRYYYEYMEDDEKRKTDGYPEQFILGKDIREVLLKSNEVVQTPEVIVSQNHPDFLFLEVPSDVNINKKNYDSFNHIFTLNGDY